ncbi:thioredoxin family protein [Haloimpatiens sp. FM7330]|uniref:thioredoxin family protein n=1 Tax=Haloimpatiens sp. FM7330 TaxID=3298610 RepID=UPI00362B859E
MKYILQDVRKKYDDKVKITIVNLEENPEYAEKYDVSLIPTLVFLNKDGSVYKKSEGLLNSKEIEKIFKDMGIE